MADIELISDGNVAGRFFTDMNCIHCGLCSDIAPENFKSSSSGDFNIVFSQPKNNAEMELCREAIDSCPVESIGEMLEETVPA